MVESNRLAGFAILILVVAFVNAREEDIEFNMKGQAFLYVDKFGFYDQGSASVNVSLSDPQYSAILFSCTQYAWRELYYEYIEEGICSPNFTSTNDCYFEPFIGNTSLNFIVSTDSRADTYYFGITSCEIFDVQAQMRLYFLNPGGEQLSSEYAPLPKVYLGFVIVWIPVLILWMANWIIHRTLKSKLHRLITLFPISKLLWGIIGSFFWYLASEHAYFEVKMVASYGILRLFCQCLLVCVFVLISRGWGIIEDDQSKYNFSVTFGFILIFVLCSLLGILFGGLFQFAMIVQYAFLVFFLFTFTNQSIIRVEALRDDPEANVVGVHLRGVNVVDHKKRLLQYFNIFMVIFCVVQICIVLVDGFLLFNATWIGTIAYEAVDWLMFLCIGITFRLRRQNVYYHLTGAAGLGEKMKLIREHSPRAGQYTAHVEPEEEADSQNPNAYHDLRPGMAGL